MCEFIQKLTFADWVDVLQMLIAGGSAYLLYLTFVKQGENDQRSKELAELEKKAKRAEYMPYLSGKLTSTFPSTQDGAGNYSCDLSLDEVSKFIITLQIEKNPIQIIDVINRNSLDKYLQFEISHYSFYGKTFSTPGTPINITYTINLARKFELHDQIGSNRIQELITRKLASLTLKTTIIYTDMIGNKYSLDLFIKGDDPNIDIRDVEILD